MNYVLTITCQDDLTLGLVMRVYDFMVEERGIEASEAMFDTSTKGNKLFRVVCDKKNWNKVFEFGKLVEYSVKRIRAITESRVFDENYPTGCGKFYEPQPSDPDEFEA